MQLTVDNAGKGWCMMVSQWPFELSPRLVIRQGWLLQPSRVTPAQDLNFQRRFYLCHSTRSVNTPSVNPGPAYPPFFGPRGPGTEGPARPVRVCARALDQGVGPSGMTMTFLDRWPNIPPPMTLLQALPRNQAIHTLQEQIPVGLPLLALEFQIGKRRLAHLLPLLHRHRGFQPYYATSPRSCSECPWVNRHVGSDQVSTRSLRDLSTFLALKRPSHSCSDRVSTLSIRHAVISLAAGLG